jgi:hypothetical protein
MQPISTSKVLAYAIAGATFCAGVAIVTNMLDFEVPSQIRYTFGIVLILMSVYRFLITYYKPKPSKWRRLTNVDDEE